MEQDTALPERFTEGVWRDLEGGAYCRIVETDESIGLVEPRGNEDSPYFTFDEHGVSKEEAIEDLRSNFRKVPEEAVENPAVYIARVLDNVQHDQYRGTGATVEEQVAIGYAREQVRIEERD